MNWGITSLAWNPSAGSNRSFVVMGVVLASTLLSTGAYAGAYSRSEIRSVETADETKIRQLREEEVTQLRIALGRRLATNRQADLYFRLAEIDLEAYQMEFVLEGRVHEKRLSQNQADKLIDRSNSRPYLISGIKACEEIIQFGIPYPKMDQIYYFLGFNQAELGNERESMKSFEYLVSHFPNSQFVGEAYRELGDEAYLKSDFRKSIGYFELSVKKSNNQVLPRVLHKLAWSYYRTKQYDRAVDTMKQAIDIATQNGEKFLSLREEALRDMALFMTESGRADEAITYFQSVAGDKTFYPRVLEKLGKQYERNVEPAKATQVYESLLKTSPGTQEAFRVLVKLVDLDLRRGHYNEALARLSGVVVPRGGEPDTQVAAQNLRAMIRRTATEHHEAYRKKSSQPSLEIAEAYYTAYLGLFLAKDDPRKETPEIEMYLAEVKRDLGKSKEASALYRKVLDSRDSRYAKEAGALWTASLAEAIKRQGASTDHSKTAEPSELEKEFVDAADQLQDALGDTSEGREAALKAAEVLAGYSSTQKDAIKRIKKIIELKPKSTQALIAARLWIQLRADSLTQAEKSSKDSSSDEADALASVTAELRKNPDLLTEDAEAGGGKLHAQLSEEETRLKIKQIGKEEKSQDFSDAAKGYEALASETSNRELSEKAYANAVQAYAKSKDPASVERVSSVWLKKYPASPKAIDALRVSATQSLIHGDFEVAAKLFEKLGREGADADSLETAARIEESLGGDEQEAAAHVQHANLLRSVYLEKYKNSPARWQTALDLARSQDRLKKDTDAVSSYRYCMAGPSRFEAECGARLGDLYLRDQDLAHAKELYKKVGALGSKKAADSSPFIAYARYKLAELLEKDAKFDSLSLPEAQLKKALMQRMSFLEPLSRAYLSALEAGGPWGVAAVDRLAVWALKFADEIDQISPSPGASPESAQLFKKNLGTISGPLRKKALANWSEAYSKALEDEVLSPALPAIVDHLADAGVSPPGRAQGFRGHFMLAGETSEDALTTVREKLTKNSKDALAWSDYGNLLLGEHKPLLAKIAYERSLALNSKNTFALNNRAYLELSGEGEEDWLSAEIAMESLNDAIARDSFFTAAKSNRAALLNYYRLFSKSKTLWQQVLVKDPQSKDAGIGLAIAIQGQGDSAGAVTQFKKAFDQGASSKGFAPIYNEAARYGKKESDRCLDRLDDLDWNQLVGFEKQSAENLKGACTRWKNEK